MSYTVKDVMETFDCDREDAEIIKSFADAILEDNIPF